MEESNNISELVRLYASNKNLFISGDLNVGLFLLSICIALATSSFVAFVYRYKHQGGFFQPSFQLSIICAALITTMVIYTIGGNLILSLGLVGALSIVRFRTAVKDAQDIIYIYWAIAIGMGCATQNFTIVLLATVVIATVIYGYSYIADQDNNGKALLTLSGANGPIASAISLVQASSEKHVKLFETQNEDGTKEVSIELWTKDEAALVEKLSGISVRFSIYPIENKFGSID